MINQFVAILGLLMALFAVPAPNWNLVPGRVGASATDPVELSADKPGGRNRPRFAETVKTAEISLETTAETALADGDTAESSVGDGGSSVAADELDLDTPEEDEKADATIAGIDLGRATPENRKKIRALLADHRRNYARAGLAYSRYIMGRVHILTGDYASARKNLELVLERHPDTKWAVAARESLAELLVLEEKPDEATAAYEAILAKERLTDLRRMEITLRMAEIHGGRLTSFEKILSAYRQIAAHPEYSKERVVKYIGGFFKGYHLLKAHFAVKYYDQVAKGYPGTPEAAEALYRLGLLFGYDLSDETRALRYLAETIRAEAAPSLLKRRAILLTGLLEQFRTVRAGDHAAFPYLYALLDAGGTDEVRACGVFFLGRMFEDAAGKTFGERELGALPDADTDTVALRALYFSPRVDPVDKAFYLYLTNLNETGDADFAGVSAARAASLVAYRFGVTGPIELLAKRLERRFPKSPWLAEIDKIRTWTMPKLYDPGYAALFAKSTALYEDGEYLQAIDVLEQIAESGGQGPEAEWAMFTIARIFEEDLRDFGKAIQRYRDLLERFPASTRRDKIRYQIARIHEIDLLDYNRAKDLYEAIVATSEDQMWVYQAGLSLVDLAVTVYNKPADAEKITASLLEKCPARRDELLYRLAKIKAEAKKYPEALKFYEEIAAASPASAYFDEALDAIVDQRLREGLGDFDKKIAAGSAGTAEVGALLSRKLEQQLRLKEYEDGAKTIDQWIARTAGTDEVAALELRKAKALANVAAKVEESIKLAVGVAEKAKAPELRAEALFFLGQTHELKTGDWVKAKKIYDLILSDGPDGRIRMNALYRRGVIAALKDKDFDRAYELYRELITKYGEEAKREGLLDKVQALLNADVSKILLSGGLDATDEIALDDPFGTSGTAEVGASTDEALVGGVPTLDAARPIVRTKTGPWFRPVRVDRVREGGSWFSGAADADPGLFWARKKGGLGWFEARKSRADWDPGADEEEIKRQQEFLDRLTFESNLPPLESPKSVYYLDWLKANPPGEKTPVVLYFLGKSYEESADSTNALAVYDRLVAEFRSAPEAGRAARAAAVVRARASQVDEARAGLERAVRLGLVSAGDAAETGKTLAALEKVRAHEAYVTAHPGEPRSLQLLEEVAKIEEKELAEPEAALGALNRAAAYVSGETDEVRYRKETIRLALATKDLEAAEDDYLDLVARFREMDSFETILLDFANFLIKDKKAPDEALPYLKEVRDKYPDSPSAGRALELLAEHLPEGDYAERRSVYEAIVADAPDLALRTKFTESLKLLTVKEKIAEIRSLIDRGIAERREHGGGSEEAVDGLEPQLFAYFKYVTRLYERELDDRKGAIATLEEMLTLTPPPAIRKETLLKLGDLYAAERKHVTAAEMFRSNALKNFDADPKFAAYLQFLAGRAYEEGNKFDEAKEEYGKTALFFPFSEWAGTARIALATFDERVKDRRAQKEREDAAERKKYDFELPGGKTAEVGAGTGEVAVKKAEKPDERLQQIYDEVAKDEKAPGVPKLLVEAANLERQLNRQDRMMEAYRKLIDNFPEYPGYYDIVFLMGEEFLRAGNLPEAIPLYKKISDERPQYNRIEYVQFTLGNLYSRNGDFIYALDVFRKLIDAYQDHEYAKQAQFELAVIQERDLKDWDSAIVEYKKMVDRYFDHPKAVEAQISIGRIYETVKNDYVQAKQAYEDALNKFPDTGRRRDITLAIERVTRMIR